MLAPRDVPISKLLRDVAAEVRRRSSHQFALSHRDSSECPTFNDFKALSESCTFLAFRDLRHARDVGSTRFRVALVRRARQHLCHAIQGRGTSYADHRVRTATRAAPAPCSLWQTWRESLMQADGSIGKQRTVVLSGVELPEPPQEARLREQEDAGIWAALKPILTEMEYSLTVAHYRDGIPQRELARRLAGKDGSRLGKTMAFERAESRVNVVLHRARQRARECLSEHWEQRAAEIAAPKIEAACSSA